MRPTTARNSAKGFTIVEILVATSIFAVIMIAALLMYDRSNRVFKMGVENADVQQNTRIAFDKVVADVRMAGFDYDRDGVPTLEGAYQSPDEQIEYVGNAAITIRANYDYNDDPVNTDHGREFAVGGTPGASGQESVQFPVVTTGNDEIVTYALVSTNAAANTGSITFYVDVPDRKAHPETGGRKENLVTITGVDLTNQNPPYTLERIALNPSTSSVTPLIRYPIATNIRSMTFEYFEDQVGTAPLTDLGGNVIAAADLASTVGGLGQYDPNATAVEVERQLRAKVQSIKLTLIGMTENPDPYYNDPNDTIAPRHRKYRLESLMVPRNYGRRGFKEQDFVEPNKPTITQVCVGYCGVAYVRWDQPVGGGAPEDYQIRADTDPAGTFPIEHTASLKTFDFVKLPDPTASYFFIVAAINSYGSAASDRYPAGATGLSAKNDTKPDVPDPASLVATALTNMVRLDWTTPDEVAPGGGTPTCSPGGLPPPDLSVDEFYKGGYDIKRSRAIFDPATDGDLVYNVETDATNYPIAIDPITLASFWFDASSATRTTMGPANCYTYYYSLRTREGCILPSQNVGDDPEKSKSTNWTDPALMVVTPTSDVKPMAPATLEVVEAESICDVSPAPDGYCQVKLKWEKVQTEDVTPPSGQYIAIGQYVVYRDSYNEETNALLHSEQIDVRFEEWDADPTITDFSDPLYVTYIDQNALSRVDPDLPYAANANAKLYHIYRVVAKQCASDESEPSPTAKYPCEFTPNLGQRDDVRA
jgi:prepilin-type N-terminal cleavage/methylation domain-containing protein